MAPAPAAARTERSVASPGPPVISTTSAASPVGGRSCAEQKRSREARSIATYSALEGKGRSSIRSRSAGALAPAGGAPSTTTRRPRCLATISRSFSRFEAGSAAIDQPRSQAALSPEAWARTAPSKSRRSAAESVA